MSRKCERHSCDITLDGCWNCGAPTCCPECCVEATREFLEFNFIYSLKAKRKAKHETQVDAQ